MSLLNSRAQEPSNKWNRLWQYGPAICQYGFLHMVSGMSQYDHSTQPEFLRVFAGDRASLEQRLHCSQLGQMKKNNFLNWLLISHFN